MSFELHFDDCVVLLVVLVLSLELVSLCSDM